MTIERAVENIDHVCQLAGQLPARRASAATSTAATATSRRPADLDTIADLQKIPELLAKRGYSAADIEAVMHGNWLRFFAEVLPA